MRATIFAAVLQLVTGVALIVVSVMLLIATQG